MLEDASPAVLSFRTFLEAKADEFGVRGHHERRSEWVAAIRRLLDQIKGWLQQADPEQLLDIEPYEVTRTEGRLGTYDAPALRIKFGPADVDLIPIARHAGVPSTAILMGSPSQVVGRIDLTDGYRKTALFRIAHEKGESWRFFEGQWTARDFDEDSFIQILQEYLS